MNIIEAIILGVVQGLTEFLPISSTAHLTIAGKLMNVISQANPERWTAFIAVIQLGTMLAVVIYFWLDLWKIITEFLSNNFFKRKKFAEQTLNSKMGWYILIGTLPIVILGLSFKNAIEGALTKNLLVISISLIALAVLLAIAEKVSKYVKDIHQVKWYDALLVGFGQAMALIPGASRSGTTITAGLFLGFNRETAARFSFLLSIPAVLASGLLELKESLPYINLSDIVNLSAAALAAGISGYLAIDFLLKFLRKNSTFIFIYYRIILGVGILLLLGLHYV
ncbi:MAG: undecaprenyl-diphosphatase UppP [Ignavibacteriales bacterium]|nr:undecaprenyl-diphosphatase UppP [Ignavibacteriales bacterium]